MEIIEITDFSDPNLDAFARLTERQLMNRDKPEEGLFIAESPLVIHRALDAGYEPVTLLMERKHIEGQAADVIARCGVPVYTAPLDVLERITGYKLTRGVLCSMRRKDLPAVEEICKNARRIVVLEDVMNPTNVGAIFRSARVSMGTVFQIPWTHIGETVSDWPHPGLDRLRALGFKTAAMALEDDSVSIDDPALLAEEKLAVILGTEGDGLAAKTIADCDYTVKIPMSHGVDSLNVAAASAVAFWQLSRPK